MKLEEGFLDEFQELEDPRIERCKLHKMEEILFLTICGVLCGCESWIDIELFGKSKKKFLTNFFSYQNGIPSDDTLRRFYRALNPKTFQKSFRNWMQKFAVNIKEEIIAIDGKTSRKSFDGAQKALHLVSAFATESRLVLGQEKVAEKRNEISAIKEILDWLDIKGSLITIDAMGCQKDIAEKIVENKGDYVFSLKGNQGNLHEDIKDFFELESMNKNSEFVIDSFESFDKGHGRIESRKCSVCHDLEWLKNRHQKWGTIKSIISLKSERQINDQKSEETRYFISSKKSDAKYFLKAIRNHWQIENSLHWILDMSFGDDQSRIRKENAPLNMSIVKHLSLNVLRSYKTDCGTRDSIKGIRKQAGWDESLLKKLVSDFL